MEELFSDDSEESLSSSWLSATSSLTRPTGRRGRPRTKQKGGSEYCSHDCNCMSARGSSVVVGRAKDNNMSWFVVMMILHCTRNLLYERHCLGYGQAPYFMAVLAASTVDRVSHRLVNDEKK